MDLFLFGILDVIVSCSELVDIDSYEKVLLRLNLGLHLVDSYH